MDTYVKLYRQRIFKSAWLLVILLISSCSIEPSPIEYGKDGCSWCSMNIVDQQHAAEFVTSKGKSYKFDAIECMVNTIQDRGDEDIAILLVADYANPGKLTPAQTATYLISKQIKSPMGAFLTAFNQGTDAITTQSSKGGKLYAWQDLHEIIGSQ